MNMLREDSQLQVQFTKVTEPPLILQATPTPKQVSPWRKRQLNTQSPPQPDCSESFSICARLTLSGCVNVSVGLCVWVSVREPCWQLDLNVVTWQLLQLLLL